MCADYLKDNFADLLLRNEHFDSDRSRALRECFDQAEVELIKKLKQENGGSGSCAMVLLLDS